MLSHKVSEEGPKRRDIADNMWSLVDATRECELLGNPEIEYTSFTLQIRLMEVEEPQRHLVKVY